MNMRAPACYQLANEKTGSGRPVASFQASTSAIGGFPGRTETRTNRRAAGSGDVQDPGGVYCPIQLPVFR